MKGLKYITGSKITFLLICISIEFNVAISWAVTVEELAKTVVFLRYRFQVSETIEGKQVQIWYKRDPKKEEYEPKLRKQLGDVLD